jgi:hypothetical protein
MTIYLYIKIHTKTGLKYFGKTTRNVRRYHGSGKYWQRHIKKHGTEYIKTLKVWEFQSLDECTLFALKFSKDNNIVNSVHWANLIEENGADGAPVGHPGCTGSKNGHFGKQLNKGRKHNQDTKKLLSEKLTGRVFDDEWCKKISESKLGKTFSEEHKSNMRGPRGPLTFKRISPKRGTSPMKGKFKHSEESIAKMRGPRGPHKSKTSQDNH